MSSTPAFTPGEFRKASASRPDKECVCVARRDGWVELRDDKKVFDAPDDHRLVFTDDQFDTFLAGVRAGNPDTQCLAITRRPDGMYTFRSTVPHTTTPRTVELVFTQTEVAAFLDGIAKNEFDLPTYSGTP
jgi:hypothetical protein